MTFPAAYTPATLDRIRKGASARSLGWDRQRFERVCRQHGIDIATQTELYVCEVADVKSAKLARASERPRKPRIPLPAPQILSPDATPRWNFGTGLFTSGGVTILVNGVVQPKIVSIFFNLWNIDPRRRFSARDVAERIGSTEVSVRGSISYLNGKLRRLGWQIEGLKGGGYRMARFIPLDVSATSMMPDRTDITLAPLVM